MSRIPELNHLQISLENIILATDNFSDNNFIGLGGFGKVYKGQLPVSATTTMPPSTTVAVKRLDGKGGQGQHEFLMEIVMLASYKHDNLASIIGFCEEGDEKIIIYKYEARGSLDRYLATDLTWVERLQICLGAARGLDYLHAGVGEGHRVLHRDIKSSNVLLDENWKAKISDFGLSKIGPTNQDFTFLVTNAAGTYGYIDPLYLKTGVLTKESDVYSFGVVLFEVLCGRLATNYKYEDERRFLFNLVKLHNEEGKLDEIIHPSIRDQIKPLSLETFSKIAYQCLRKKRHDRPTMGRIVKQLQRSLDYQLSSLNLRKTEFCGSNEGGDAWSVVLDSNQKLRKIMIDHDDWLYSICFTIEDFSGSLESSPRHGGAGGNSGGRISEVDFNGDEELIGIFGTVGKSTGRNANHIVISSLCFKTTKNTYGPFGKETGTSFSVPWDVGSFAGFYGRAGFYLDGLGCYVKATI